MDNWRWRGTSDRGAAIEKRVEEAKLVHEECGARETMITADDRWRPELWANLSLGMCGVRLKELIEQDPQLLGPTGCALAGLAASRLSDVTVVIRDTCTQ